MVRYHIDDVNEEMVLAESVFTPSGELLLAAGYKIKERYKERLKQIGYNNLLIEVEGTEEARPASTVSNEAQREMTGTLNATSKELSEAFVQFREKSTGHIKEIIKENRQHFQKFIMNSGMTKALEQFIDEIMSQTSVVLNLSALQQTQPGLIEHALNVAISSLCIGKRFKFSYEEMKQLGIGALNYDLGLVALPPELVHKTSDEMDEEELKLYKQHTVFGYIMLSQNHIIPSTSTAVALQHHECQDGGGYPRGLKGDNRPPLKDFSRQNRIHRFAEIVAVADRYDMLLTGRNDPDHAHRSPKDVIRDMVLMSGETLNSEIIRTLLTIVPLFPVGARVRIVNAPTAHLIGYFGVVAHDNPADLENPLVLLYETKNHQRVGPISIDLSKHSGFELELVV